MTSYSIAEAVVHEELALIAPDIDSASVDSNRDLLDEFDIDSMDFLTLITAIGKRLGQAMPESDYAQMRTLDGLIRYLAESSGKAQVR